MQVGTTAVRRVLVATTAAAALAATLAACGGGASGGGAPAAGSGSPGSGASAGKTVTVTETEFHLAMSTTTLSPGRYTFVAHNAGSITHALEISGPGVADTSTGLVTPGQTKSVTVTLSPGGYDVFCPVANHKAMGMDAHVTVS